MNAKSKIMLYEHKIYCYVLMLFILLLQIYEIVIQVK